MKKKQALELARRLVSEQLYDDYTTACDIIGAYSCTIDEYPHKPSNWRSGYSGMDAEILESLAYSYNGDIA